MKTSVPPAGSLPPEVIPPTRATKADDKERAMDSLEALTTQVLGSGDARGIAALSAHADPRVRYAVAFYLGGRDDEAAESMLIALSADPDRDVRDWATFALGSLQTADSAALREALVVRLTDPDDEIRGEAILGLARRRDERAVSAVLAELRATASSLAIEAAGELAREIFLPELERLRPGNAGDSSLAEAIGRCRPGPGRG
jgi:HEAT repeat protein